MIEKQSYKKNVFLRNTNQTFSCHIIKIHYVTISQFDIFPLHPILCIFLLILFHSISSYHFPFFSFIFVLRYSCLPFCQHHVILNHFSYRYKYIYIVSVFRLSVPHLFINFITMHCLILIVFTFISMRFNMLEMC